MAAMTSSVVSQKIGAGARASRSMWKMLPDIFGGNMPKRARKMYQVKILPQIKACWIHVKRLMVKAICAFTAQTMQVNIAVPIAFMSAVWPLEQKDWTWKMPRLRAKMTMDA